MVEITGGEIPGEATDSTKQQLLADMGRIAGFLRVKYEAALSLPLGSVASKTPDGNAIIQSAGGDNYSLRVNNEHQAGAAGTELTLLRMPDSEVNGDPSLTKMIGTGEQVEDFTEGDIQLVRGVARVLGVELDPH